MRCPGTTAESPVDYNINYNLDNHNNHINNNNNRDNSFDYSDNNVDFPYNRMDNTSLNIYNKMDSKNNSQTDPKTNSQKYGKYGKRRHQIGGHDW